jgi:hypothetical protein
VRLGARLPFAQVAEELAFLFGVSVSPDTVRRLTEQAGALQVTIEQREVERLEQEAPPEAAAGRKCGRSRLGRWKSRRGRPMPPSCPTSAGGARPISSFVRRRSRRMSEAHGEPARSWRALDRAPIPGGGTV